MKKFASIVLLALSAAALPASPEVDEMDRKAADSLSQAEAAHPIALDAMNKSYLLALQKLEAERQKDGDLKQLLLVRDDLKAFNENLEIRKGSSFPRLKLLRDAYLKEFHKLQLTRLQKRVTLLETHRTNLVNLQKKLTRNDLIAEALEVDKTLEGCGPRLEKAREELAAWSEVKPENAIAHLRRKHEGEGEKTKGKRPATPDKEPEETPASPTTTNPFADPKEEPVPEPAKPAEKPAAPESPFDAPTPAPAPL